VPIPSARELRSKRSAWSGEIWLLVSSRDPKSLIEPCARPDAKPCSRRCQRMEIGSLIVEVVPVREQCQPQPDAVLHLLRFGFGQHHDVDCATRPHPVPQTALSRIIMVARQQPPARDSAPSETVPERWFGLRALISNTSQSTSTWLASWVRAAWPNGVVSHRSGPRLEPPGRRVRSNQTPCPAASRGAKRTSGSPVLLGYALSSPLDPGSFYVRK
jgi:hypothetical protein